MKHKTLNPEQVKRLASVEGRANMGHKSNFTIIEGYGKLRISVFEIRAGRSLGTIRFPPMYGLFNETNAIFSISGCKQRIKKRAECRIYRGRKMLISMINNPEKWCL